jgi:nitroreductase
MLNTELLKLFEQRQSVRSYKETPVEKDKLLLCIEAARIAPSASNAQPWKYIVVDDPALKEEVAKSTYGKLVTFNKFTHKAPVLIVLVREKVNTKSSIGQALKGIEYPLIDIGISAIQFCLQASAEGLSTCIMGWFNARKIKRLLSIPRNKKIALIISVGYADSDDIRKKVRKPIEEVLSFNSY